MHFKPGQEIFTNMVTKVNSMNPDILIFSGDMVDNIENIDSFFSCIQLLNIECFKYAILGNWEYWSEIDLNDFRLRLEKLKIKLLVNDTENIVIRNKSISIFGLDDYLGGNPDFSFIDLSANSLNIIIAHCPILFEDLVEHNKENIPCYMLSGHTHGGQITFLGIPIYTPDGSGKFVSGIYKNGNNTLYVSRGIGNSTIDFRLFSNQNIEELIL